MQGRYIVQRVPAHTSKRKNIDYIQIVSVYIHTHSIITCTYKTNMHL
jgi:hypothetical protein